MKAALIKSYFDNFESHIYKTDEVEFWFTLDLQKMLGYAEWRNFLKVIDKTKLACENAGGEAELIVRGNAGEAEFGKTLNRKRIPR
jgi:DNA-damage-inducible protein D